MVRELADLATPSVQVTAVLADTYKGPRVYEPGGVRRSGRRGRASTGVGGRCRTRRRWVAAHRCRCHHHHRPLQQNAAATWKKTYGHHPLPVFLARPDIADSEALVRLLRVGNAGSNTATDHITVLGWALHAHVEGSASDIARRGADALWRNLIDNRRKTAVRQPA